MPKKVIAYHKDDGPVEMYSIDAREAANNHPDEWSLFPWAAKQTEEAPKLMSAEDAPDDSENLPVIRTVQVVDRDGVETVQIGSGHEDGKPPRPRPGFAQTERLAAGIPALGEGEPASEAAERLGIKTPEPEQPEQRAVAADVIEADDGDETEKETHVAKHRGNGSYSVMKGDVEVEQGLSRDEAKARADELNKA